MLALAAVLLWHDSNLYVLVVVHLTLLPAVLYPLVYSRMPWWKSVIGRALMHKAMAVGLLYIVSVWAYWQPLGIFTYVYAGAVTYLGLAITMQFIVMLRQRRAGRHAQHFSDELGTRPPRRSRLLPSTGTEETP